LHDVVKQGANWRFRTARFRDDSVAYRLETLDDIIWKREPSEPSGDTACKSSDSLIGHDPMPWTVTTEGVFVDGCYAAQVCEVVVADCGEVSELRPPSFLRFFRFDLVQDNDPRNLQRRSVPT
jgi:hypothetical protein